MTSSTSSTLDLGSATIRYDRREGSNVPLVFIHGWACRRRDWDAVVANLSDRAVLLIDLPWHGESTSDQEEWTIARFGQAVAETIRSLGLERLILVGHSMGGAVALEAASLLHDRVDQVLGVDSLTYGGIYPPQSAETVRAAIAPFEADFVAAVRATVEALFTNQSQATLIDTIAAEMASIPKRPGILALRGLLEWDLDAALARLHLPVTVLASRAYLAREVVERYGSSMRIIPVDLGGHFFLREDPAGTARELLGNLRAS